jgi:hypothetical protein
MDQRGDLQTRYSGPSRAKLRSLPCGSSSSERVTPECNLRQHLVLLSFMNYTVLHHETHVGKQINIRQWITTDRNDVGLLSRG